MQIFGMLAIFSDKLLSFSAFMCYEDCRDYVNIILVNTIEKLNNKYFIFTWRLETNAPTYSCVAFQNDCTFVHSASNHAGLQWCVASSIFERYRSRCDLECVHYQWMDIFCRCMYHRLPIIEIERYRIHQCISIGWM